MTTRPKLTAENVVDYLDWLTENVGSLVPAHLAAHLQAAELVIRTQGNAAQAKATQHTLVEEGIIAPPPPPG
jgi:hypothetical protein